MEESREIHYSWPGPRLYSQALHQIWYRAGGEYVTAKSLHFKENFVSTWNTHRKCVGSKNLNTATHHHTHKTLLKLTAFMCLGFPNNGLKIYPEDFLTPNKVEYSWSWLELLHILCQPLYSCQMSSQFVSIVGSGVEMKEVKCFVSPTYIGFILHWYLGHQD